MKTIQASKKLLPFLLLLFLLAACAENPTLEDAVSNIYQVGDEWAYNTRPGEPLSTFIVAKIDKTVIDGEEQTIIHIAITGLAINDPDGGQITGIPHMPFTEESLNLSAQGPFDVVDPIPQEYLDAYQKWRERYLAGEAAVFESTIATALNSIQATVQSTAE